MGWEGTQRPSIVSPDGLTGVDPWQFLVGVDCQEDVGYIGLRGRRELVRLGREGGREGGREEERGGRMDGGS